MNNQMMIERVVNIIAVIVIAISTIVIGSIFVKGGDDIAKTFNKMGSEISNFVQNVSTKNEVSNKEAKIRKITNPTALDVCYMITIVGGVAVIATGATILLKECY